MKIMTIASAADLAAYDAWVKSHPCGSLWQSLEWKAYQTALGRDTHAYVAIDEGAIVASALAVVDRTVMNLSVWDLPRGPLWTNERAAAALLEVVANDAKRDRCLALHLSPVSKLETQNSKLKPSPRTEQPEATRIVDLTLDDETLLANMHPKGRYNIKVAQKNGVRVEESTDVDAYAALAEQTAIRDRYKTAPKRQYEAFLEHLPGAFMLLAHAGGSPVAGLIGATWNGTGIYYYGASDHAHRALMAPYLLQWEAMQRCKREDCVRYDLLGVAPPNAGDDHPWKGISAFKEKFGGALIEYPKERRITFKPTRRLLLTAKRKIFG